MKVAYLSLHGIDDPKKSSCTPYFVAIALRSAFGEVIDISPKVEQYNNIPSLLRYDFLYIFIKYWQKIFKTKRFSLFYRKKMQTVWANYIMRMLEAEKPTFIFADKCSVLFRYINTNIPIFYYSDATAKLMVGYYADFDRLPPHDLRCHIEGEKIAMRKCTLFIPPSHWAAESALKDYGLTPSQVHVIRSHPTLAKEIDRCKAKEISTDKIRFLFVGGDWVRKGGDIAISIMKKLLEEGRSVEMTILCKTLPADIAALDCVNAIEFIDRSIEEGEKQYHEFFRRSDFFILPSTAEALGQVYIDALMHGLPSIAYRTGGVPEMVRHNHTGLLFELDESLEGMVKSIATLTENPAKYGEISKKARDLYLTDFSFTRWSTDLQCLVDESIKNTANVDGKV